MRRNRENIVAAAVVLVLIFGASLVIYGCAKKGDPAPGQAKIMYHCPMHPTYVSDKPGDCPICGMRLVKMKPKSEGHGGPRAQMAQPTKRAPEEKTLEEVCLEHKCTMNNCTMSIKTGVKPGERIICPICGEFISTASGKVVEIATPAPEKVAAVSAGPSVTISAEKQQLIGVKTEPVRKMNLAKVIRASGKIAYDPELVVTQEEFIQALKNEDNIKDSPLKDVVDRAKSLTSAARNKLKLLGMSDGQISELEKTRKAQTNLYLPGKGENVWAYVSIYEYEIGLIHVGAGVEIEATAYPGEVFSGHVVSINPVLDAATRTNQVRVEVTNYEDKLKPEMFVNGRIKVDLGEKLAVPESAVLDTGLRKIVYLSRPGDILESREVKTAQKAGGYYEILGGLSEGDIVVTSGNFLIDSETRLKSAVSVQETADHKHGQ